MGFGLAGQGELVDVGISGLREGQGLQRGFGVFRMCAVVGLGHLRSCIECSDVGLQKKRALEVRRGLDEPGTKPQLPHEATRVMIRLKPLDKVPLGIVTGGHNPTNKATLELVWPAFGEGSKGQHGIGSQNMNLPRIHAVRTGSLLENAPLALRRNFHKLSLIGIQNDRP